MTDTAAPINTGKCTTHQLPAVRRVSNLHMSKTRVFTDSKEEEEPGGLRRRVLNKGLIITWSSNHTEPLYWDRVSWHMLGEGKLESFMKEKDRHGKCWCSTVTFPHTSHVHLWRSDSCVTTPSPNPRPHTHTHTMEKPCTTRPCSPPGHAPALTVRPKYHTMFLCTLRTTYLYLPSQMEHYTR